MCMAVMIMMTTRPVITSSGANVYERNKRTTRRGKKKTNETFMNIKNALNRCNGVMKLNIFTVFSLFFSSLFSFINWHMKSIHKVINFIVAVPYRSISLTHTRSVSFGENLNSICVYPYYALFNS